MLSSLLSWMFTWSWELPSLRGNMVQNLAILFQLPTCKIWRMFDAFFQISEQIYSISFVFQTRCNIRIESCTSSITPPQTTWGAVAPSPMTWGAMPPPLVNLVPHVYLFLQQNYHKYLHLWYPEVDEAVLPVISSGALESFMFERKFCFTEKFGSFYANNPLEVTVPWNWNVWG